MTLLPLTNRANLRTVSDSTRMSSRFADYLTIHALQTRQALGEGDQVSIWQSGQRRALCRNTQRTQQ